MNKVIIAILIGLVLAAVYGLIFGLESWSHEQSWAILAVVAAVVVVWVLAAWLNRNESRPKR